MNGDPHEVGCGGSHMGRFGGPLRKMGDDGNQLSLHARIQMSGGVSATSKPMLLAVSDENIGQEVVTSLP